jgi:hypothetical protein
MRSSFLLVILIFGLVMSISSQTPFELAEMWEKEHVSNKFPSNTRHRDLLGYLDGLRKLGVKVEEVGRSYANREIYQVEFGKGHLKVFMWSQMHGDEPTATPALIDMFKVLQNNRDKEWVKRIEEILTIRAVPMLNPDGAELFIRRNLQGIDINRDARDLKTPEGQLLKRLRDDWSPEIGFNLHNQNVLTAAGPTDKQAAISFLVVYGDAAKTESIGHDRNKRLVAAMTAALNNFIPGHIARYSDEWTPTAFGDNFSALGTPTILIETGGLHSQDEMFLVKMNFIAFLAALSSLADGSERNFSPMNYEMLPRNSGGRLMNLIFRNANIIDRSKPDNPEISDIGINIERRREEFSPPSHIRRMGQLTNIAGLDEYDASDFYVVGRFQPIKSGNLGELLFYKRDRQVNWASEDLENEFPPDAIFSLGSFVRGAEALKKIR